MAGSSICRPTPEAGYKPVSAGGNDEASFCKQVSVTDICLDNLSAIYVQSDILGSPCSSLFFCSGFDSIILEGVHGAIISGKASQWVLSRWQNDEDNTRLSSHITNVRMKGLRSLAVIRSIIADI